MPGCRLACGEQRLFTGSGSALEALRDDACSNTIRYLGVNIVAGHKFACSLDNCQRSFYRAFNAIFGKFGRIASEHVIELLKGKCLPALYYGLEACPVNKSQIRSLEYVLNNTFRKIFATRSIVATDCV